MLASIVEPPFFSIYWETRKTAMKRLGAGRWPLCFPVQPRMDRVGRSPAGSELVASFAVPLALGGNVEGSRQSGPVGACL